MRARRLIWLAVLPLLAAGFVGFRGRGEAQFEIGIWYWHSPFRVSEDEARTLRSCGVGRIYVRAATFRAREDGAEPILPQSWKSGGRGIPVVLCFNFEPALARGLERASLDRLSADLLTGVQKGISDARSAGADIAGVQFDADCPTRLVGRYAELLSRFRSLLDRSSGTRARLELSATMLPTWLGTPGADQLARVVDVCVPQFYENRPFKTLADFKPVGDPAELERGLRKAARLPGEFLVGLPVYGHAVLFDGSGKIAGMYRRLSAGEALRHPGLAAVETYPSDRVGKPASRESYVGEDVLIVRAPNADSSGQGMGFAIAYSLPTPEILRAPLRLLRADRPANCRGIALFRFPEPGESTCLSLDSLSAALRGRKAELVAKGRLIPGAAEPSAFSVSGKGREVRAELSLEGSASTFACPGAVSVLILFDQVGIEEALAGDFDFVRVGLWDAETRKLVPASGMRSNAVLLERGHAAGGQRLRSGSITHSGGATRARIEWRALGPGGFESLSGASGLELRVPGGARK